MSNRALITGALAAIAVLGIVAAIFQQKQGTPDGERLPQPYQRFMACLPGETTEGEKTEIRGILSRYHKSTLTGKVGARDQMEMGRELNAYIEKGSIDRKALNQFMARVSYYTHRTDPSYQLEDSSGIHPLLDAQADSTR